MKKKVDMKNIRDYEHYDKQRSPEELENHLDSRYDCESDLMKSLMHQAIDKFNIKTFYELAITNESLWSINDWPEGEGFGSSDRYWSFKSVEDTLKSNRKFLIAEKELAELNGMTECPLNDDVHKYMAQKLVKSFSQGLGA